MKKMAEFRSEFLHELVGENENFSEEQFCARLKEYLTQTVRRHLRLQRP